MAPKRSQPKRPWQDVANEAQEYRDASVARVPGFLELYERSNFSKGMPKNASDVLGSILDPRDFQITELLAEQLVVLLASGELSATDVTTAYLRRAGLAQKLVNTQVDFVLFSSHILTINRQTA